MRRSTVLSLPLQLVFPALIFLNLCLILSLPALGLELNLSDCLDGAVTIGQMSRYRMTISRTQFVAIPLPGARRFVCLHLFLNLKRKECAHSAPWHSA
jgi:hypothetical protein